MIHKRHKQNLGPIHEKLQSCRMCDRYLRPFMNRPPVTYLLSL